jgi:MOSC domain-containing protein YiiM
MSELVSIVYKPMNAASSEEDYLRIPLAQTRLVVDYGIEGDAKGGNPTRQLNLMSAGTLQHLAQEGFRTAPGQMGEQLIVADLEIDHLPCGTRLQIGEQACVELTEPRTGCGKFERYQDKKREEAAGRLGMMARVVVSGTITTGDVVQVVAPAE